jgi:hypothetical protein
VNIVHTNAFVVHEDKGGKKVPSLGACQLCDGPDQIRIALGTLGTVSCAKCLRAALVELIEAIPDASMTITTEIDGVEQTSRVNVSEYEERDE